MKNNIVVIILVVVIGMIAFWYLGQTNNTATGYLTTDTQTTDVAGAKDIYNILQKMAQVTLDDGIFTSVAFQSLKDNTVSFSPQASGRNNPFAPLGTDTGLPSQQISTTTPGSGR